MVVCLLVSNKKHKRSNYFASSNPHSPHSRAYDREHGCVNSSMVFEWLGAYDCPTSFALKALSTCLCVVCEPISRTQTSVPLAKAKPPPRRNPTGMIRSCSGGILGGIHWRATLAGYSAGSTGEQLWQDTGRDPLQDSLSSCSGRILGGGMV